MTSTRSPATASSRDTILARIREALRVPAPPPHVLDHSLVSDEHTSPNHGGTNASGFRSLPVLPAEAGRPWLPDGGDTPGESLAILIDNLEKLRAEVHRCQTPEEAAELVQKLASAAGWQQVAWHNDPLVGQAIATLSCETLQVDGPQGFDKDRLEGCQAGISSCEALVAQTGSILVGSGLSGGRGLSILPPVHIVVATLDQIVGTLGDAMHLMQERHGGRLPSMLSFITGASRTGDIERILVLGAHGPKELHVILIG